MSDFGEIFEPLPSESEDTPTQPTFRATIRRDQIMVTQWAEWLVIGGPLAEFFRGRSRAGVAIADVTIEGEEEDELLVRFLSDGGDAQRAERVLGEWAGQVGYRRLWLPSGLIELEPDAEAIGRAEVRCPTCRARWSDRNPEFWQYVRAQGSFPRWCPLCGCELPQWKVEKEPVQPDPGPTGVWGASDSHSHDRP